MQQITAAFGAGWEKESTWCKDAEGGGYSTETHVEESAADVWGAWGRRAVDERS